MLSLLGVVPVVTIARLEPVRSTTMLSEEGKEPPTQLAGFENSLSPPPLPQVI